MWGQLQTLEKQEGISVKYQLSHLRTVYIVKKFAVLSNEVGAGPEQEDGQG